MAEELKYADSEMVSLYCYVDTVADTVDAILTFNLFGMATRLEGKWQIISREDPEITDYLNNENYDVWKIDWDKEPIIDADPADENAWEHQLVQAWDKEEKLTSGDLEKYAHKINIVVEDAPSKTTDSSEE
jgi:hypothetical protein|tara:strand:- start:12 stop:404 length:393 start_codon:yes stop_codon:yes gene_type:complete